jgi:hypothetical protein
MFNKIYKFLKINIMTPSVKQKCGIWLAKDLRQYRLEYRAIMSHMIGSNWVLGNKTIDTEHLAIKKIFKIIILIILLMIFLVIIY